MCAVGKAALISCQISFYPLYTVDCISSVKEVVSLIEANTGITCSVNDMSTIVKGERGAVMKLLEDIQQRMEEKGIRYSMVLTISNSCGCALPK